MKKKINYEISYDIEVELTFDELTEDGIYMFKVLRYFPEGIFDASEDEITAEWVDGVLLVEGYDQVPNQEEEDAIIAMVMELDIEGKIKK